MGGLNVRTLITMTISRLTRKNPPRHRGPGGHHDPGQHRQDHRNHGQAGHQAAIVTNIHAVSRRTGIVQPVRAKLAAGGPVMWREPRFASAMKRPPANLQGHNPCHGLQPLLCDPRPDRPRVSKRIDKLRRGPESGQLQRARRSFRGKPEVCSQDSRERTFEYACG